MRYDSINFRKVLDFFGTKIKKPRIVNFLWRLSNIQFAANLNNNKTSPKIQKTWKNRQEIWKHKQNLAAYFHAFCFFVALKSLSNRYRKSNKRSIPIRNPLTQSPFLLIHQAQKRACAVILKNQSSDNSSNFPGDELYFGHWKYGTVFMVPILNHSLFSSVNVYKFCALCSFRANFQYTPPLTTISDLHCWDETNVISILRITLALWLANFENTIQRPWTLLSKNTSGSDKSTTWVEEGECGFSATQTWFEYIFSS